MITKRYSTDVTVTCPCCGRSAVIRSRVYARLSRIESPAHERALHRLVAGTAL